MSFPKLSFFWDRLRLLFLFVAIVVMANLAIYVPLKNVAFAQVPLEGQSETIEKSLRHSLPQEFPSDPKAPKVTKKNSTLNKPGEVTVQFLKILDFNLSFQLTFNLI